MNLGAQKSNFSVTAICVSTYCRPIMLRGLLKSLAALRPPASAGAVHIVLVDNDAEGSAGTVIEAARSWMPFPMHAQIEPQRNIATARNRSVAMAQAIGADHIAFIDDDERVQPDWLERLFAAKEAFGADIVSGQVCGTFPDGAPEWVRLGRFFTSPGYSHGSILESASTSNVLCDAAIIASVPGPFDERFGISGGSDSFLFLKLSRSGARIVWAADAAVEEEIPQSRTRARWLVLRAIRVGQTSTRCELAMERPRRRLFRRVMLAFGHLGYGLATLPIALLRGRWRTMHSILRLCWGFAMLSAFVAAPLREYKKTHGG